MTTTSIIGTLFLLLGTALLVGVAWLYMLARGSLQWATTEGLITSSKVDSTFESTGSYRKSHRLVLTYQYTVDGHTLTGHRIQFGDAFWSATRSPEMAEKLRRKYAGGQEVTVHYDPARPARCTLIRNVEPKPYYLLFAIALGLVVAGIAVLAGLIRVM